MSNKFSGEALIQSLDRLRNKLINSGTQRTAGLLEAIGPDCTYYLKSANGFMGKDYEKLRQLVIQVNMLFEQCEEDIRESRHLFPLLEDGSNNGKKA